MANKTAFINAIKGQAIKDMQIYGILASLTIAQAILESGWGESGLTQKANNLFGIKAGSSWNGATYIMETAEYRNGIRQLEYAKFRKYSSWADSITDHTKLLLTARYKCLIGEKDYKTACKKIKECGYATDINYTNLLIQIIEQYKLYEYDTPMTIKEWIDNMNIKDLQEWLNRNGFTDNDGNRLVIDGKEGTKTKQAKEKAKNVLSYILK